MGNDDNDDDTKYENDLSERHIFINDDLTRRRSHLLWKARQLKKANKISDCWSYDGKILVKDLQNKIINIANENDLEKIN